MSTRLELIDTATASEVKLRRLHEFYIMRDTWDLPDDLPMPFKQRLVGWRYFGDGARRVPRWVLWDGDTVAATSGVALENSEDNRENCWGFAYVHPDHRGQGLSRLVISPMLDVAQEDGRTRIGTPIKDGDESEGYAERAGLKPVILERRSRLVLAEVDRALVASWIEQASGRASDYELIFWEGAVPDEYLQAFCDVLGIMNTAPREHFEEEDFTMTPELWRAEEKGIEGRQITNYTYVARHQPTGEFAGYTNVFYQRLHPLQAYQIDTGVDPDHREKGLGRWLKAAMLEVLLTEHPEVAQIDTENAGSNEPMLNINIALGFKPVLETRTWQGDIATTRANLGV